MHSLIADATVPAVFYAGVINDKEFGGVFVTRDNGATWQQMNAGLGPRDVFVVPSWKPTQHEALDGECVLFSFSDRPVQEKIGVWREDRGNA